MTPSKIRKGYVDTAAGQMHYRTVDAAADTGAPVVFFHRSPISSASFDRLLESLAGWRRLIAFDTPGFGESFTPPEDAAMPLLVDAFAEAMRGLGIERPHLVGHHSGCHFAAELAVRPEVGVQSLLMDGAMVAATPQSVPAAASAPVINRDGSHASGAWGFIQPYYTVFDERCAHDEFVGAMHSLFTRSATMNVIRSHDLGAVLARVTCPVVASAAEDDVFVGDLERIAAILPSAEIRKYGPAGIASPELQTEVFGSLVKECAGLGEA